MLTRLCMSVGYTQHLNFLHVLQREYKNCSLLGRAERVNAPTALPTVMESADGPQEARRPQPGNLFKSVSAEPYAMPP